MVGDGVKAHIHILKLINIIVVELETLANYIIIKF